MKNRRLVIVAFVLVAVICLGVGFAALQDTLTVDGTISFDETKGNEEFDEDVYFTAGSAVQAWPVDATQADGSVTFEINAADNDKLTITVGNSVFSAAGQELVVNAKVKNDSTDAVKVAAAVAAEGENAPAGCTVTSAETTIAAGETGDVALTIKLTSTNADTATFTVTLNVTSAN